MENEEYSDSTEALVEEIRSRKASKPEDIIAMQSVVCILIAVFLIAANYIYPDTAEALYGKICRLSQDKTELIPNPIDLIIRYIDKL